MAYTPYFSGYQPLYYQPSIPDQLAQLRGQQQFQPMQGQQMPPVQPQQNGQSMIWVNGEQEAFGYLVAPNSAVALWDSTAPVIYLKQADASGKPSMKTYDLVERTQRPVQAPQTLAVEYAPLSRLEALEARLDALSAVKEAPKTAKKATAKEDME